MNKELYGKSYDVPSHILEKLRNSISKYSNQSVENLKRAKEISETGKVTYQQLKRIKNWFDSNNNSGNPEYQILGGEQMNGWVNTTLDTERESVRLPKDIKSVAMDNQHIKAHTKNDDVRTDFRPQHSHKKKSQRITGISEEIQNINNWFKKLII